VACVDPVRISGSYRVSFPAIRRRIIESTDRQQADAEYEHQLSSLRRQLNRRTALLRLARHIASEPDPTALLSDLLAQAITLVGGDEGLVYRWDEDRELLVLVRGTHGTAAEGSELKPGEGATGQALARGGAVILNDYAHARQALQGGITDRVRAVLAVPIFHAGRRLGVLTLFSRAAGTRYSFEDAETLELLAGIVAATLVGLERAQVRAVVLTARDLTHRLHNDLAVVAGMIELVQLDVVLPAPLARLVQDADTHLAAALRHLARLNHLARFETKPTPVGPALDLERSLGPAGAAAPPPETP
jgi:GAF domain-containing protein